MRTRRKPAKGIIPATELVGPTPEQMRQADYVRSEIMHVESFTRATVHRVRQASSLLHLLDNGQLNAGQYFSALQIASVAEQIERAVAVKCASLEARVDHANSGRDVLVERIGAVRLERAYTEWRQRLPMPRRMVIDMVLTDRTLKATAARYRMGWPRAKARLADALDLWAELIGKAMREIEQVDLDRAQARVCA